MSCNHVDNVTEYSTDWLRTVRCSRALPMHSADRDYAVADAMDALGNVHLALETDVLDSEDALDAIVGDSAELVELRRLRDAVANFFYSSDSAAYERLERAFERVQSCGE